MTFDIASSKILDVGKFTSIIGQGIKVLEVNIGDIVGLWYRLCWPGFKSRPTFSFSQFSFSFYS